MSPPPLICHFPVENVTNAAYFKSVESVKYKLTHDSDTVWRAYWLLLNGNNQF